MPSQRWILSLIGPALRLFVRPLYGLFLDLFRIPPFALLTAVLVYFFIVTPASAKETLVTTSDRTVVYAGPGENYRPLIILPANTEVPVSPQKTVNKRGEFYKVQVTLSNRHQAIGYIPTTAEVRKKSDNQSSEDIEKFADYPRAQHDFQIAYSHFKSQNAMATLGFMKYAAPDFYLKGFIGAFKSPTRASPVVGGEIGSDGLLAGGLSGFISLGGGVFLTPRMDSLFPGNRDDFSNFLVQGTLGLRYHFSEKFSFGLGGTQAAIFNANNSLVTWGAILSIEVGL